MTKVKICGLTRKEDIEYVNEVMPDYVGFVFAKSKRQLNIEKAKELIKDLDKSIKTVGVFVNEDILKVKEIATSLSLDVIQFHGNEDEEYLLNFKEFCIWKVVSIKVNEVKGKFQTFNSNSNDKICEHNKLSFYELDEYQKDINIYNNCNIEAIVLDSHIKGMEGGTGITFDWRVISRLNINGNLVLAGGLNLYNVDAAINILHPYVVDVSSGVETEGIKDFNKMKMFIEKVRNIK